MACSRSSAHPVPFNSTSRTSMASGHGQHSRNSARQILHERAGQPRTATDRPGGTVLVIPTRFGARPAVERWSVIRRSRPLSDDITNSSELLEASRTGDADTVRRLLAEGIDPDARHVLSGYTA